MRHILGWITGFIIIVMSPYTLLMFLRVNSEVVMYHGVLAGALHFLFLVYLLLSHLFLAVCLFSSEEYSKLKIEE